MVGTLEKLLETINLRAGYEKRIENANIALLAIKDFYAKKKLGNDYIITVVLSEAQARMEQDAKRNYPGICLSEKSSGYH